MDKKISFAEQPTRVKVLYGVAIAILCVTAIVIGLVSVASRKEVQPPVDELPPAEDGGAEDTGAEDTTPEPEKPTVYISPAVGEVSKSHSVEVPVYSNTLGEWRMHTGIDITADEGTEVRVIADGKVSRVYNHPLHGKTVEVAHSGDIVSVYSNLGSDSIAVKEGDIIASGAKIGAVGDTSLTELADEPHLHFEIMLKGVSVNPLDYISEESKKASLTFPEA